MPLAATHHTNAAKCGDAARAKHADANARASVATAGTPPPSEAAASADGRHAHGEAHGRAGAPLGVAGSGAPAEEDDRGAQFMRKVKHRLHESAYALFKKEARVSLHTLKAGGRDGALRREGLSAEGAQEHAKRRRAALAELRRLHALFVRHEITTLIDEFEEFLPTDYQSAWRLLCEQMEEGAPSNERDDAVMRPSKVLRQHE